MLSGLRPRQNRRAPRHVGSNRRPLELLQRIKFSKLNLATRLDSQDAQCAPNLQPRRDKHLPHLGSRLIHCHRLAAAIDGTAIGACFGSRCVAWRRTIRTSLGSTFRPATTAPIAGAAITRTATPWTTRTAGPGLRPATHSLGDASFQFVGVEEAVLVGVDFVESALETLRSFFF